MKDSKGKDEAGAEVDKIVASSSTKGEHRLASNGSEDSQVDADEMSVSKDDLIRLLSALKSELHSKDIALASIKLEQLKRLMNPVEISRSNLASTYIKLQNRLKNNDLTRSRSKSDCIKTTSPSSASNEIAQTNESGVPTDIEPKSQCQRGSVTEGEDDDDVNRENFTILNTLLELLDRHPLLALPRDSIYCLDYNCNELSTKNYLNLKIQHLENLIDQHRRFRYYIGERLKRSELRYIDLTLKLEHERSMRMENERSAYENGGKATLLKEIERLRDSLEKEKASKHAIVMTLLNELLDERERNEILSHKLLELASVQSDRDRKAKSGVQQQQSTPAASNQQTAYKPRVPAKPAQLLDRQRSQTKNG